MFQWASGFGGHLGEWAVGTLDWDHVFRLHSSFSPCVTFVCGKGIIRMMGREHVCNPGAHI